MSISSKLKELRLQHGYLQKDVCEKLKIAQNTLSGYESGARKPKQDTLIKLAEFYGVTTDYLLGQENTIDNLEEEFPEAIQLIRKANAELSKDGKEMLIKMMKAIINK
ncbi:MAG: helix-turn-helix domain-containing protein [Vallitalea sp.]|jgi:transcriptional regulator with XRE-family HTH domain|nr:helix-turn-helix domain-containing protein [Vallitalea sp.]